MRNLIRFIIRNHIFLLFILLEVICVILIFRQKNYHHVKMVNASASLTGGVYNTFSNVTAYFSLKQVNDSLARELAKTREAMLAGDSMPGSGVLTDTSGARVYEFIPARVIKSEYTQFNNYITINKGRTDSVTEGMGVVSMHGVVGIVVGASKNFASVMSVLHHEARISCKLKKDNQQGSLIWEGTDPTVAYLEYITEPTDLSVGDSIVTTGASTFFPPEQMVGTIEDYELREGANFYHVKVRLSTRFDKLKYVFVVKNNFQEEQLQLEEATQQ